MQKNKFQSTTDRIVYYALFHLDLHWDDVIEDDLGISHENYKKIIRAYLEEKIFIDKPTING